MFEGVQNHVLDLLRKGKFGPFYFSSKFMITCQKESLVQFQIVRKGKFGPDLFVPIPKQTAAYYGIKGKYSEICEVEDKKTVVWVEKSWVKCKYRVFLCYKQTCPNEVLSRVRWAWSRSKWAPVSMITPWSWTWRGHAVFLTLVLSNESSPESRCDGYPESWVKFWYNIQD